MGGVLAGGAQTVPVFAGAPIVRLAGLLGSRDFVSVPVDFGQANITVVIVDEETGRVVAEMESEGCGQIYEVIPSFLPLGQSRLALKKAGRSIAKEITRMNWNRQPLNVAEAGAD